MLLQPEEIGILLRHHPTFVRHLSCHQHRKVLGFGIALCYAFTLSILWIADVGSSEFIHLLVLDLIVKVAHHTFHTTVQQCLPGDSIGDHLHTGNNEIYYVLSGSADYNDNGTTVKIEAGDVTVCNDGESHGLVNTGSEPLHLIALILNS